MTREDARSDADSGMSCSALSSHLQRQVRAVSGVLKPPGDKINDPRPQQRRLLSPVWTRTRDQVILSSSFQLTPRLLRPASCQWGEAVVKIVTSRNFTVQGDFYVETTY